MLPKSDWNLILELRNDTGHSRTHYTLDETRGHRRVCGEEENQNMVGPEESQELK